MATLRRNHTGHTSVRQGQKVIVIEQNGNKSVRKFKEHKSKFIIFYDGTKIALSDIATLSIYKVQTPFRDR